LALWQMWLIAAALLAIVEIVSTTFVILWFAIGAVVAGLAALAGADFVVSTSVFLLVSLFLVLFTRSLATNFLEQKNNGQVKTNLESLVGRIGLCLENIREGNGLVKLGGETWSAAAGEPISAGEHVKVVGVEGVKLLVEKLKEGG